MTSPVGRISPACQTSMRPRHDGGENERVSLFVTEPAPDPEAEEARSVVTSVASVFTEMAVSQVTTVELEGEGEADMFWF